MRLNYAKIKTYDEKSPLVLAFARKLWYAQGYARNTGRSWEDAPSSMRNRLIEASALALDSELMVDILNDNIEAFEGD